jgi:uncharacterized protein (TIGR02271 family)
MDRRLGFGLAAGAIAGGVIGFFIGTYGTVNTMWVTLAGVIVGAIAGGVLGVVIRVIAPKEGHEKEKQDKAEEVKMVLREERLQVDKERVKTGEVHVHRERIEEEQTVKVPVVREEIVIETKEGTGPEAESKTIRIPVKEERLEVLKHAVVTGDVKVYKNEYETMEEVTETLRKEVASVEVAGKADVTEEQTQAPH